MLECQKPLWIILIYIRFSNQFHPDAFNSDPIESYCASFNSCWECKKASEHCDWCHDVGCTHLPNFHCPQKLFLDKRYKSSTTGRFCTEIDARDPIFIPANLRRFIKMNLYIDDLTLYKRNIMCEIHIEKTIFRVKAVINDSAAYCDSTVLKVTRSVSLGYIRLIWGGADPYSNMILIIVYKCEYMASSCVDCQVLDKGFNCGWCEGTSVCTVMSECPNKTWIANKKSQCSKYKNYVTYYNDINNLNSQAVKVSKFTLI